MFHLAVIAATLTCTEAHQLVNKMNEFRVEEETRTEMIQIVKDETAECWDANADWRNGFYPPNPEDKPMAQVTYRGIKYDTEHRPNQTKRRVEHEEVYRGVKFLVDSEGHKRVLSIA